MSKFVILEALRSEDVRFNKSRWNKWSNLWWQNYYSEVVESHFPFFNFP
jgi:hypothetical protein